MRWHVYKFTRPMLFEFLGEVIGSAEPHARGTAMKRWPQWARANFAEHYVNGRLHLHRADAKTCHCGMTTQKGK